MWIRRHLLVKDFLKVIVLTEMRYCLIICNRVFCCFSFSFWFHSFLVCLATFWGQSVSLFCAWGMLMDFKEKEFSNILVDIPHKNLLKLRTGEGWPARFAMWFELGWDYRSLGVWKDCGVVDRWKMREKKKKREILFRFKIVLEVASNNHVIWWVGNWESHSFFFFLIV